MHIIKLTLETRAIDLFSENIISSRYKQTSLY